MNYDNLKPFVKWAGGKRQLLPVLEDLLPKEPIFVYCEPFVGGGALLFHLHPQVAIINDLNTELINTYIVIRDNADELIKTLSIFPNTEEFYYWIRGLDRDIQTFSSLSCVERAARFIFLNKTCFNGLYRVNKQGQFNVSYGGYTAPDIINAECLYAVRDYLNSAEIHFASGDFQYILENLPSNAFVYFDPPYLPDVNNKSFVAYNSECFSLYDHLRLHEICNMLTEHGIKFMQSNSCTPITMSLYSCYDIQTVQARRSINCDGNKRGAVNEIIIRNYI